MIAGLVALVVALTAATACDDDAGLRLDSVGLFDAGVDAPRARDAAPGALRAVARAPRYATVGALVVLDGRGSTGAVGYRWTFGNGKGWSDVRSTPTATVTYAKPGRNSAVLEVFDRDGSRKSASVVVGVTYPATFAPRSSAPILRLSGTPERVAVVSPDSAEVAIIERDARDGFRVASRRVTCAGPRTIAQRGGRLLVACPEADTLDVLSLGASAPRTSLTLPRGSRPFGVVATDKRIVVSLQGTGQLAEVELTSSGVARLKARHVAVTDARAVAALPDGRFAVTRWRSPATNGVVVVVDPTGAKKLATWPLKFDPQAPSDTEIGGVPSYLAQVLVSPTGREVVVPSLQANIRDGAFRTKIALKADTTVRAVLSFIALPSGAEAFDRRFQFDGRGFASGAAISSRGDYLFVTTRGAQVVERVDLLTDGSSGSIFDVGFAPEGAVLSADDRFLYVNAYMSRQVAVYDVSDFSSRPKAKARLAIVGKEPLSAVMLRGKQIFNDSADPRLSKDRYIACAHCHLDGDSDHLVWDFTARGEGLRNTISLLGRRGADGPLHWSANFDEVQDFEHDIRGPFGGTGLMSNAAFNSGTRNTTLGAAKAGASKDLDALAAYVASLAKHQRSPFRTATGALTTQATQGRALFSSTALGCAACHRGARLTDSALDAKKTPRLHDVGTLGAASGKRLNAKLTGIDTPTLHGLWSSAPYLHDGSAASLRAVLTTKNPKDRHGKTSALTVTQLDALVAYLRSLDGRSD